MAFYHIFMISLVASSIILLILIGFIKGNKQKICSIKEDDSAKSALAKDDIQRIMKICNSWYTSSKLWCCVYYALNVLGAAASVITVYIASLEYFVIEDIVLYSVLALVCNMTALILRCETKTIKVRESYNKMQTMLYKYEIGKCSDEELVNCFDECEKEITKFYM